MHVESGGGGRGLRQWLELCPLPKRTSAQHITTRYITTPKKHLKNANDKNRIIVKLNSYPMPDLAQLWRNHFNR
jgi:hypothetical protein